MSNSLDPDQARRFVGPDLGPNCLPRLTADVTGRRVKAKTLRLLCVSQIVFSSQSVKAVSNQVFNKVTSCLSII